MINYKLQNTMKKTKYLALQLHNLRLFLPVSGNFMTAARQTCKNIRFGPSEYLPRKQFRQIQSSTLQVLQMCPTKFVLGVTEAEWKMNQSLNDKSTPVQPTRQLYTLSGTNGLFEYLGIE